MDALIVTVALGALVLVGGVLQQRLRVPAPWSWIVLGAAVGFVPGLQAVALPSAVMLYLFLPVLLFWETLNSSAAAIRRNLRVIVLLGVGLVFATAAAVAGLGVLAGLPVAMAVVLGAVVSPTDATAVAALSGRLPRRNAIVLQGESLINDAAALALFTVALTAAEGAGRVPLGGVALDFVWAAAGGTAVGLLAALVLYRVRAAVTGTDLQGVVSLLSPFVLFLPAQLIGASGVVAVVAGGLLLSRLTPAVMSAAARTRASGFWQVSTFAINGALFVLIGAQTRSVVGTVIESGPQLLGYGALVAAGVLVVRFVWLELITVLIRALDRRAVQRTRRVPIGTRLVTTWGGFRGAVSLAVALAIPVDLPGRDRIVAITWVVIVFTVFVQGGTMPGLLRRVRLPAEPSADAQRAAAEAVLVEAALDRLDEDAAALQVDPEEVEQVRHGLQHAARVGSGDAGTAADRDAARRRLQTAAVARKRQALLTLRATGAYDDEVLRGISDRLDVEDLRRS